MSHIRDDRAKQIQSYFVLMEEKAREFFRDMMDARTREAPDIHPDAKTRYMLHPWRGPKEPGVYICKVVINGKIYYKYGQTTDMKDRLRKHRARFGNAEVVFWQPTTAIHHLEGGVRDLLETWRVPRIFKLGDEVVDASFETVKRAITACLPTIQTARVKFATPPLEDLCKPCLDKYNVVL